VRALIVGAGIGGLAATVALEDAGVEVIVVERGLPSQRLGLGIALGPNALAALERLGARELVLERGNTAAGRAILDRRGRELTAGPWHGGIVRRADLYEALSRRIRTEIRYGTRVTDFQQRADGVTIRLDDRTEERVDMLIGADGLRSETRARLFGAEPPTYRGTSWRGIAQFEHRLMADRITETWGCGQRVGLQNLGRGWTYWFAANNAREGTQSEPETQKRELLELFRGWHKPVEAVLDATDPADTLQTDLYDRDPLPSWNSGRITLLGDAAHPMTPDLGQGASQALEDAVALGDAARAHTDVPLLLAAYEGRRLKVANTVVRRARRHFMISHLESPLACAARNAAVRILPGAIQLALGVRRPQWSAPSAPG
jgi:2-polyprenyl-6-methoxyphenol hydroxylase-like FAD-dependent oxidoreductase